MLRLFIMIVWKCGA